VHVYEALNQLSTARTALARELGRNPTIKELAARTRMSPEKVTLVIRSAAPPASLDAPVTEDSVFGTFLPDTGALSPESPLLEQDRLRILKRALASLTDRERLVLELRYGIVNGHEHTLQEISERLEVSRERIRQIEAKALERLRRRPEQIRQTPAAA
jgi:RNA polymerase primary sigma factor